jgi:hypothetical protein
MEAITCKREFNLRTLSDSFPESILRTDVRCNEVLQLMEPDRLIGGRSNPYAGQISLSFQCYAFSRKQHNVPEYYEQLVLTASEVQIGFSVPAWSLNQTFMPLGGCSSLSRIFTTVPAPNYFRQVSFIYARKQGGASR